MSQEQWNERLARYQCLEPLLAGRRVLEVGCGTGRAAEHLAELAVQVDAIDTSTLVLQQARRHHVRANLEFSVAEPDRLDFPADAFDVVLVPELQRWFTRGGLIPELRRVLAPGGVCVFAVPSADSDSNTAGLSYNDFIEYLAQGFNQVRLLGEVPFRGTIMADFEPDDELVPELDCTLVDEDEPPLAYLAICGDDPVAAIGYTVVQLPGGAGGSNEDLDRLRLELDHTRQQLRQTEARADEWAQKAESATAQTMAQAAQLEASSVQIQQMENELQIRRGAELDPDVDLVVAHTQLKVERDDLLARIAELEAFRAERQEEAGGSVELEELQQKLAEAERRVLEASTRGRAEVTATRRELRDQVETTKRVEEELGAVRKALDEARALLARRAEPASDEEEAAILREELEATKSELQQTVEASRARIAELDAELARARKRAGESSSAAGDDEVEPLRRWVDSLTRQVEVERARADAERERADQAVVEAAEDRGRKALEHERVETALQAVDEQRRRAETAEQRCDGLIVRIEQGVAELSKLHERVAELQALRQSERWRIDELTGRLRECQGRLATSEQSKVVADEWRREPTNRDDVELKQRLLAADAARSDAEERVVASERETMRLRDLLKSRSVEVVAAAGAGDPMADVLRGDLERAEARIVTLEGRCDTLLAEAQRAATVAQQTREELSAVAAGKGFDAELQTELSELRQQAGRVVELEDELAKVREEQGRTTARTDGAKPAVSPAPEELRRQAALFRQTQRAHAALEDELASTRQALEDLRRRTTPSENTEGEWQGEELLIVRERQVDALLAGALQHKQQSDQLLRRLDELEGLAAELNKERVALEQELAAAQVVTVQERERAEDYRQALTEQGRQLAQVEGLLLRERAGRGDHR